MLPEVVEESAVTGDESAKEGMLPSAAAVTGSRSNDGEFPPITHRHRQGHRNRNRHRQRHGHGYRHGYTHRHGCTHRHRHKHRQPYMLASCTCVRVHKKE